MSLMYMNEIYKQINILFIWEELRRKEVEKKRKGNILTSFHPSYESKGKRSKCLFISKSNFIPSPVQFGWKNMKELGNIKFFLTIFFLSFK